jgi:hypothetical protein
MHSLKLPKILQLMRKWCTNCDEFDSASLHVCRFFTQKRIAKILLWFFLVVMAVVVALNKRSRQAQCTRLQLLLGVMMSCGKKVL